MSITSSFYGINSIVDFRNIFGSNDLSLAKTLYNNYIYDLYGRHTHELNSYEQEYENGVFKKLQDAVCLGGDALTILENEESSIFRIILRAQCGTIISDLDWGYYPETFFSNILENVSEPVKPLINYLLNGRRLFGEGPVMGDTYAYLYKDEMKIILEDMIKNPERYSDSKGFDKDFKNCLELFVQNDKDLFYWIA